MSGLPALRCFIFLAADLFILVLPSFGRKAPEQMGQGFTHIYRFKFPRVEELVSKPRVFRGIERLHQPVDRAPDPRDAATARVVGEPDIERQVALDIEWHDRSAERLGIGRKDS